jgi:hypothetical protein
VRAGLAPAALGRTVVAGVAGFVAGMVVMLSSAPSAVIPVPDSPSRPATVSPPVATPEPPGTFLAWTFGGLPDGFAERVGSLPGVRRMTVVASGMAWLDRSLDATGSVVDQAPEGMAFPLEVAAVDPSTYAHFLPPAERAVTLALADGEAVLGASSAELRRLRPGGQLVFGDVRLRVSAVIADELLGAHEVLVSSEVGRRIGVVVDRYALLQPGPVLKERLLPRLRSVLPAGSVLQVRAPGETPYFRMGDAVLPIVRLKEVFGEFAGRPVAGGYIESDPRWVREQIVTARVPVLGQVRCHRVILPLLRGALREVGRRGLSGLIDPSHYGGCYASRTINRVPGAALSHHSWGIAIDINVAENPLGRRPTQDPRLVAIFESWGFTWGGNWLRPDGMHFEFSRFPTG